MTVDRRQTNLSGVDGQDPTGFRKQPRKEGREPD